MPFILFLVFFATSCAGLTTSLDKAGAPKKAIADKSQVGAPQKEVEQHGTTQHQNIFFAAKKKIEVDRYAEAKPLLEEYLRKAPNGLHVDQSRLFLGQLALRDKAYPQAEAYFNSIISRSPPSALGNLARFYRAKTWDMQGKKQEALADLANVRDREGVFPDTEKLKLFLFWGQLAKEGKQSRDAALAYRRAYHIADSLKDPAVHEARIGLLGLIEKEMTIEDLESFLRFADIRTVPGAMALKRYEELKKASEFPTDNGYTPLSEAAVMDIANVPETYGEVAKVGLLLPVENTDRSWGKAVYDGMQLALRKNNSNLQFIIQNPGPTVASAIQAYERLVNEHKVMVVVGPLSGEQSQSVAKKAEAEGVPFFSMSPRTDSYWGATTVNFSFDFKKQAEALVKYAHEQLSATRYAMIFPRDEFGKGFAEAFAASVLRRGSTFTAMESFPVGQVDFRKNVENMVGLGNLIHARWGERDALIKEMQAKLGRPLKDKEKRNITLPPIVDFDVLFIPDSYKVMGQVAPLLAYYDIDGVTLMGPSTWNSPQVIQRAGQFLDDGIFVDFFSKTSPNEVVKDFLKSFEIEYGKVPGALSALGFDLASSLSRGMRNPTSSRKELLKGFLSMGDYVGVLGLEKWDDKRDPLSELQVFKINKSSINWQQSLRIR
ncbi:MAG: penicillin-binding protein activator [Bdellovibrionota bacterium]